MLRSNQPEHLIKLVLLGDSNVGKTYNVFEPTSPTVPVDFKLTNFKVAGKLVRLQIWDTAGQERFRTISASYYRGAHGIIVMYDVTRKLSFGNLGHWMREVNQHAFAGTNLVLVGNKCDLGEERMVEREEASQWASSRGLEYFETSGKTGTNVQQVIRSLVHQVVANRQFQAQFESLRGGGGSNPAAKIIMGSPEVRGDCNLVDVEERKQEAGCCGGHALAMDEPTLDADAKSLSRASLSSQGIEVEWEPNGATSTCRECEKSFSTLKRRHHCRWCGRVYCDDCSRNRITRADLPVLLIPNPVDVKRGLKQECRVCNTCHEWLQAHGDTETAGETPGVAVTEQKAQSSDGIKRQLTRQKSCLNRTIEEQLEIRSQFKLDMSLR